MLPVIQLQFWTWTPASAAAWGHLREADNPPVLATRVAQLNALICTVQTVSAEVIFIDSAPVVAYASLAVRQTYRLRAGTPRFSASLGKCG